VPSWKYTEDKSDKIQTVEAHIITWLVKQFQAIYKAVGKEFIPDKTLGIITPYRNQIAHLRNYLQMNNIENYDKITIDTVERYQGSQRDIILISFCVNSAYQLKNLVAMTDDGVVDRKLNVALTRGREQMSLVGNPS
jgi:DNA replication ATP-dependent helicase Dna2